MQEMRKKMSNLLDAYKHAYRYGNGRPLNPIPEQDSKPSSTSPTRTATSSLSSYSRITGPPPTPPSTGSLPAIVPNSPEDERSWLRDLERERDRRALIRAAKRAHQLAAKTNTSITAPFTHLPKINGDEHSKTTGERLQNNSGHSSTSDYSSLEEQSAESDMNGVHGGTMNYSSDLSLSEEYQSFRASVPLRKVAVDSDSAKTWKIYDAGPRRIRSPLICLAPVSGTADIFYKQILSLSSRGVRVIAAESPIYWSVNEWCEGFKRLLDYLDIDKVHIFGASLGGFLAQKFAEYTYQYSRVASLILCNTFTDTSIFNLNESALVFWMLPAAVLKKMVIGNLSSVRLDRSISNSIDFMTERLDGLSQQDIASRLTINCVNSSVDPFKLRNVKMTLVDVFDDSALTSTTREELYKCYPHAKTAHLKTGGNFPYLSRSDEVSLHLLVHLRTFNNTRLAAIEGDEANRGETKRMVNGIG